MSEETSLDLVLGFIGDQAVHPANAVALLSDFIDAHRKLHKSAKVRFIVPVEPLTSTLEEIAEFCLQSKYKLELLGHQRALDDPKAQRYSEEADMVIEVPGDMTLGAALIGRLTAVDTRVILLADPDVDDDAYFVLEKASEQHIIVRSLLNGLDMVIFNPDTKEQPEVSPKHVEEEDYDEEDEDLDEDEDTEEDDEDLEDEDEDLEDEDEEGDEDEDDEPEEDDEDDEDDEEPAPVRRLKKVSKSAPPKKVAKAPVKAAKKVVETEEDEEWTEDSLAALEKEELYAVAAEYDVFPGKGIKVSTMISRVLEAQGGEPAPKPAAKKVAAPKVAPPKAPAAKKVAPAAPKESTPAVDSSDLAAFFRILGEALIEAAKSL